MKHACPRETDSVRIGANDAVQLPPPMPLDSLSNIREQVYIPNCIKLLETRLRQTRYIAIYVSFTFFKLLAVFIRCLRSCAGITIRLVPSYDKQGPIKPQVLIYQ